MKKNMQWCVLALGLLLTVSACQKEVGPAGANGTNGADGPVLVGDMVGYVNIYNEFGAHTADNAGVTATVENTTPAVTAVSNAAGRFVLTGLKTGTYNISFTKSGYNTHKYFGIGHAGGTTPTNLYTVDINETNGGIISNFTATLNPGDIYPLLTATITPTPTASTIRQVFTCYSKNPQPDFNNAFYTNNTSTGTSANFSDIEYSSFSEVPSGTRIYVRAYISNGKRSNYFDLNTGLRVYTYLGQPSGVASFVKP